MKIEGKRKKKQQLQTPKIKYSKRHVLEESVSSDIYAERVQKTAHTLVIEKLM